MDLLQHCNWKMIYPYITASLEIEFSQRTYQIKLDMGGGEGKVILGPLGGLQW